MWKIALLLRVESNISYKEIKRYNTCIWRVMVDSKGVEKLNRPNEGKFSQCVGNTARYTKYYNRIG